MRQTRVKRIGPTFDLTRVCLMRPWPFKLRRPLFRGAPWLRDTFWMIPGTPKVLSKSGPGDLQVITKMLQKIQEKSWDHL